MHRDATQWKAFERFQNKASHYVSKDGFGCGPIIVSCAIASAEDRFCALILSSAGSRVYEDICLFKDTYSAALQYLTNGVKDDPLRKGLATVLLKYFGELTTEAKQYISLFDNPIFFDEMNAGQLASTMIWSRAAPIINWLYIECQPTEFNAMMIDTILPRGKASMEAHLIGEMQPPKPAHELIPILDDPKPPQGIVDELIDNDITELLATEASYIERLQSFVDDFICVLRVKASRNTQKLPARSVIDTMFPCILDSILDHHNKFLQAWTNVPKTMENLLQHFPSHVGF